MKVSFHRPSRMIVNVSAPSAEKDVIVSNTEMCFRLSGKQSAAISIWYRTIYNISVTG